MPAVSLNPVGHGFSFLVLESRRVGCFLVLGTWYLIDQFKQLITVNSPHLDCWVWIGCWYHSKISRSCGSPGPECCRVMHEWPYAHPGSEWYVALATAKLNQSTALTRPVQPQHQHDLALLMFDSDLKCFILYYNWGVHLFVILFTHCVLIKPVIVTLCVTIRSLLKWKFQSQSVGFYQ